MGNSETHEIWNGEAGHDWARNQSDLDHFLADAKDKLMRLVPLERGDRVLEIGCGSGSMSLALADAVGPTGQVLGLDVSEPLLCLARRRAEGRANLSFRSLDIQTDRLTTDPFRCCIAQVGMMFFSDPVLALRRIRAHLVPGAVIAFNGWAGHDNPWFAVPLRIAEARLGPLPTASQEGPPPPGPLAFADVTYVTGLLAEAGYRDIAGKETSIAIRHPDGLEALMRSIAYVGPISTLYRLRQPGPETRAQIAEDIRATFAGYQMPDGSVNMPGTMTYYRATAP